MKTFILGVALLVASTALAKEHDWKTGKIISQNISSDSNGTAVVPIGGIIAAVPIRRVTNTVVMEANGYRVTLVEKQQTLPGARGKWGRSVLPRWKMVCVPRHRKEGT